MKVVAYLVDRKIGHPGLLEMDCWADLENLCLVVFLLEILEMVHFDFREKEIVCSLVLRLIVHYAYDCMNHLDMLRCQAGIVHDFLVAMMGFVDLMDNNFSYHQKMNYFDP